MGRAPCEGRDSLSCRLANFASRHSLLLPVELTQLLQSLADAAFQPARRGLIELDGLHPFGKITLARSVSIGLIMRIAVRVAIAELLHQPRRCIAQVDRHRTRSILCDEGARLVVRDI